MSAEIILVHFTFFAVLFAFFLFFLVAVFFRVFVLVFLSFVLTRDDFGNQIEMGPESPVFCRDSLSCSRNSGGVFMSAIVGAGRTGGKPFLFAVEIYATAHQQGETAVITARVRRDGYSPTVGEDGRKSVAGFWHGLRIGVEGRSERGAKVGV